MATASLRYLSPRSVVTMSRLDHTIIPVHEDPTAEPLFAAPVADMQTATSSNQRAKNQFRPRAGKGGATSYQLRQYAEVTLGGGSLRKAVKLPEGEDENEWLAVNSESCRKALGLIRRRPLTPFLCSGRLLQPNQPALWGHHRVLLAPVVSRDEGNRRVGQCRSTRHHETPWLTYNRFEYLWQDGDHFKRPTKMPAPAYIEQLMTWVQASIDNESILPSKIGMYSRSD